MLGSDSIELSKGPQAAKVLTYDDCTQENDFNYRINEKKKRRLQDLILESTRSSQDNQAL